jgi:hypothetical protein
MRVLAVTAAAFALLSGAARADDAGRLRAFLPVARAAWPASPCAGREAVHLGADRELAAWAPRLGADGLDGMARAASCEAWLRSGLDDLDFCVTLTHELGHLAGRPHVAAPGDVMNGDGDRSYAPCAVAAAPRPVELVRAEMLPPPRAAWRVDCALVRPGHWRHCRATRAGARARTYLVRVGPSGWEIR